MENLLAKALYDNTAESPEELAFRKGDIITVMEQNVDGSHGWWRCSLHGRQGLAPANRLHLLSPAQMRAFAQVGLQTLCAGRSLTGSWSRPNIYQTPTVPRPPPSEAYEPMDRIYRVPFSPKLNHESSGKRTTDLQTSMDKKHPSLKSEGKVSPSKIPGKCVAAAEVYDVPTHPLRAFTTESNYDVPMSLATENQQRTAISGCTTLPNPRKSEWVYDVPLKPEKYHGTMMAKPRGQQDHMYDTLPPRGALTLGASPAPQAYDVPNPSPCLKNRSTQRPEDQELIYDVPPTLKRQGIAQKSRAPAPVKPTGDVKELQPTQDDGDQQDGRPGSDISVSSTGSCESSTPRSSSPELVREVTLTQDEAACRLAELQEAVCQAVPRLMVFVSSRWRTKDHLAKHIREIQAAAQGIAGAMAQFLDFVLDVRGNANQLSDANLQLRLHRQLSIVKDSGLILQEAMATLAGVGWQLNTLVQDSAQAQTPDQLERFVMVARTIPEDVRHLVSILNANGKLLFRRSQKDHDKPAGCDQPETKNSQMGDKQISDSGGEDNDYVHLQTKMEFEKQQMMEQKNKKSKQVAVNRPVAAVSPHALSEHCRLYFGALQKAIGVLVHSLQDGQPPESFIDQGKLVIMVGQRLVDTLCREAQGQSAGTSQDLLYKGNQLCALLKQLAVATKKAALHYPDKTALQEVEDFAKELAHRAQHFRTLLDQSAVSRE
uniref:Cas scaffold protein family member 4 n=1 Tax=Paramormyrops kingsleyae TaxID=1676925 RepID=A0A3B3RS42_9TELE|nr:cas scaffolding protein family member 4-like [Paramormyrops kingsleyae]